MEKLEGAADGWFKYNVMKLNSSKCNLLVSGHKYEHMICNVGSTQVIELYNVKFLGILIDSDLTFDDYVDSICKKA